MKPWPRFMEIALFPIRSVVIGYIDLLHSTNFLELIPLWTTAALLEKHSVLIIQLVAKQKPASPMVCCTRGQLPPKPLLPPPICSAPHSTHRWPALLLGPRIIWQALAPCTSTYRWWLSFHYQHCDCLEILNWRGVKQALSYHMVLWGSFLVFFSSLGHSCTQWQNSGSIIFWESC